MTQQSDHQRRDRGDGARNTLRWRGPDAAVATLALLLAGSLAVWATWTLNRNITKVDVSAAIGSDRPTPSPSTVSAVNILLIGSDTRTGEGNDSYGAAVQEPGDHSDTNLVVHLSADRSWATVVSIPGTR